MATGTSDFFPALLEWTEEFDTINKFLFEDNPVLGLLPTATDIRGKYVTVPFQLAANPGGGANFGNAKAAAQASSGLYREFQIPVSTYFQFASVDDLTAELSKTDKGAFESAFKAELEGAMINFGNNIASVGIWGTGNGARGNFTPNANITSAGIITLANPSDAIKFPLGAQLQAVVNGVPLMVNAYVIGVNYSGGQIVVDSSPAGTGSIPGNGLGAGSAWNSGSTTAYLSILGDFNNLFMGIPSWIVGGVAGQVRPGIGQPSSVNMLYNVDRSQNPDWMAGIFLQLTNYSIEEACIQAVMQARRIGGGKQDIISMNPVTHAELQKELTGRREYMELEGPTGFTYKALTVAGERGPIAIVPDRFQPPKTLFGLQLDTWKLCSAGQLGHIFTYQDGIQWFRDQGNSTTLTYGGYPALYCRAPGRNFVATVAV